MRGQDQDRRAAAPARRPAPGAARRPRRRPRSPWASPASSPPAASTTAAPTAATSQVAAGPPDRRGRGGQHLLGPELGLLGPQPQGRLDGVAGGEHADPGEDRGQEDVGDAAAPARGCQQDLGGLAGPRRRTAPCPGRSRAEGQAGHGRPDRPAGQGARAAAARPGPSGLRSQDGAVGRPEPGRPGPRRRGRAGPAGPRRRHQQDHRARPPAGADPPALAGEGPEPLGPADGRQPRQPATAARWRCRRRPGAGSASAEGAQGRGPLAAPARTRSAGRPPRRRRRRPPVRPHRQARATEPAAGRPTATYPAR